ncbi:MAG: hypothetical protein CMJ59_02510 [Planctomycetaceae bacterium]|nr:hypothetical protein [Planctomycetaceae bacterium]
MVADRRQNRFRCRRNRAFVSGKFPLESVRRVSGSDDPIGLPRRSVISIEQILLFRRLTARISLRKFANPVVTFSRAHWSGVASI